MTAEVVIMNAIGVAMAADSAVTIGTDARKIFTSTDKLFQLSRTDPIGVMAYNNSTLLGIPWEAIIKQYRATLRDRSLPSVGDHATSFLRFVEKNSGMFPRRVQDGHVVQFVAGFLRHFREDHLRSELDKEARRQGKLRATHIRRVADATLGNFRVTFLADRKRLVGLGPQSAARVAARYRRIVRKEFEGAFGTMPVSDAFRRVLVQLTLSTLTREAFGPSSSGLVFAGFGAQEYLPTVVSYHVDCFVDRKLRVSRPERTRIEQLGTSSSIIPFAQREVVDTFMAGVDRRLKEKFGDEAERAIRKISDALVDAVQKVSPSIAAKMRLVLRGGVPRVVDAMNHRWDRFSSTYWRPITEIVATLPKDELAAMAEALVNLTKFKRRITPQKETVGGPIDVAVITRGDGFVWIKRKHYFDPALNPRAVSRISV